MNLKEFIQSFFSRKGGQVLTSFLYNKITNFIVAIAIIRLLTKEEYGFISYAVTIIAFIVPFMGAGIHQGFLRYGSLSDSQINKKKLFQLTLKKGILYSTIIMLTILMLTPFITANMKSSSIFLMIFSFQLIGLLIFQFVGIYCRLINLNQVFAKMEIINNTLILIFCISMGYLFKGVGYITCLVVVPFLVGLYFMFKLGLHESIKSSSLEKISLRKYIDYGLSVSIGGIMAQLLFAVDILLIGNILKEAELVAQYKAASILPFSLLFIPVAIITTDFVKISRAAVSDKAYIKSYFLNYLKIFGVIALLLFVFFYFMATPLLSIFGKDYAEMPELLQVFAFGIVGGILFRVPLGNILSAIGWPKVNAFVALIILILNVIGSYCMIQWYGIIGAAITTSLLMWLSGFFSLGAFIYFLNQKK